MYRDKLLLNKVCDTIKVALLILSNVRVFHPVCFRIKS